ncbi:hypothetical protein CALCODRAFT_42668 [Calocera cornea HHB12733]|uniref:Uncharacterized protein n=1 Tax=Calocera cornea HHB12733 TaxID=1353952 RepID=A0A165DVD4_9BASI|nr:hypothetical protein CALCODRAFT_42668 [Calocera cornea HHB12733]
MEKLSMDLRSGWTELDEMLEAVEASQEGGRPSKRARFNIAASPVRARPPPSMINTGVPHVPVILPFPGQLPTAKSNTKSKLATSSASRVITIDSEEEEEENITAASAYSLSPSLGGSPVRPRRHMVQHQEKLQDLTEEQCMDSVVQYLASGHCYWPLDDHQRIDWVRLAKDNKAKSSKQWKSFYEEHKNLIDFRANKLIDSRRQPRSKRKRNGTVRK